MSLSNDLTQKILLFFFNNKIFAWRASTTGIFDQRRGIYRFSPKKGVADVLAVCRGRLIAIEIKIGKDKLSPEQKGFIESVNRAGGYATTISSYEEFIEKFKNVIK